MNIIKELRRKKGIQQKELALEMGVSRATVSDWESNKKNPSGERLKKLADYFNVDELTVLGKNVIDLNTIEDDPSETEKIKRHILDKLKEFDGNTELITYNGKANVDRAATKATEILIKHHISIAPISPLEILKSMQDVFVVSFTDMVDTGGLDRSNLEVVFGAENQDAITLTKIINDKKKYFVAYNQNLPYFIIQRALARELGHIVMQHATFWEEVESTEALFFARHLLCPRPLINALQETGVPITVKVIGNITGCYGRTLAGIRRTPGANVPADLNRLVKAQFAAYIDDFQACQSLLTNGDDSPLVDCGSYMDNYAE